MITPVVASKYCIYSIYLAWSICTRVYLYKIVICTDVMNRDTCPCVPLATICMVHYRLNVYYPCCVSMRILHRYGYICVSARVWLYHYNYITTGERVKFDYIISYKLDRKWVSFLCFDEWNGERVASWETSVGLQPVSCVVFSKWGLCHSGSSLCLY